MVLVSLTLGSVASCGEPRRHANDPPSVAGSSGAGRDGAAGVGGSTPSGAGGNGGMAPGPAQGGAGPEQQDAGANAGSDSRVATDGGGFGSTPEAGLAAPIDGAPPSCVNACEKGRQQCRNNMTEACVEAPEGCTRWMATGLCPSPQSCNPTGSMCICPAGGCTLGSRMCGPNGGAQDCVSAGACTAWGQEVSCSRTCVPRTPASEGARAALIARVGMAARLEPVQRSPVASRNSRYREDQPLPWESRPVPTETSGSPIRPNVKIGRMTVTGEFVEFAISSKPQTITAGADQNLWFTMASNKIGKMNTAGVLLGEFDAGLSATGKIVAGPDGNLWFTQCGANAIGRMTVSGARTDFPVASTNVCPFAIVAGSDGNLWFTELFGDRIGRIAPGGQLDSFPLARVSGSTTSPPARTGSWFAEFGANRIGRMSASGRLLADYPVPTPDSGPAGITRGPDGNFWFTEIKAHEIGRITREGVITEFPTPTPNSAPYGSSLARRVASGSRRTRRGRSAATGLELQEGFRHPYHDLHRPACGCATFSTVSCIRE